MKILCAISGIEFTCDHFPATLHSREAKHPIFSIPQKKLIGYSVKWSANELTEIDSYLLFLALLNSTDLIHWKTPASISAFTPSIIANNMEDMFAVIGKINIVKDHCSLPQFVINTETKDLRNIHYWLESWHSAIQDYRDGYREADINERMKRRENALQRIIAKNKNYPEKFAGILADWAATAGNFPIFDVEVQGEIITCAEYWKRIIKACVKGEKIFSYPKEDLTELIEHCETDIPHGTTYAHTLMSLLRDGQKKQHNYLGLGDTDLSSTVFRILDTDTSVEDANIQALIDSAPLYKPKREDYPSDFAFFKAKVKYDLSQQYKNGKGEGK